jgi:23S rRNA (pseudouridine1915-N3)-methyltransferase
MTIKLLTVGQTDSRALQTLISIYTERLKHYINFEIITIPDLKNTKKMSEVQQKVKEGDLILKQIQPSDRLVLLDEKGKSFSSEGFANFLQKQMNAGIKNLVFVVGGPYGFSDAVYDTSDIKVSLSNMTFSHQMIRLFIVEQLYRGFSILNNHPYHHS